MRRLFSSVDEEREDLGQWSGEDPLPLEEERGGASAVGDESRNAQARALEQGRILTKSLGDGAMECDASLFRQAMPRHASK